MAVFEKSLTPTDTTKRLSVPAKALPAMVDFSEGHHSADLQVMFGGRHWNMSCTKRQRGYRKPVLSKGWLRFVRDNNLKAGDRVSLYKEGTAAGDGCASFRIQVQRTDCPAAPRRKVRVRNAKKSDGSMHSSTSRPDPDVGNCCRYGYSSPAPVNNARPADSGSKQRTLAAAVAKEHINLEAPAGSLASESLITWDGGPEASRSDLAADETEGPNLELELMLAPPAAAAVDDLVKFKCIDFLGIGRSSLMNSRE